MWLLKDCFLLLLFYGLIIFSVVLDIINLKAFNVCKYLISLHCVNIPKPPLSTQSSKFLPCYNVWTKRNTPNRAKESPKHCSNIILAILLMKRPRSPYTLLLSNSIGFNHKTRETADRSTVHKPIKIGRSNENHYAAVAVKISTMMSLHSYIDY